MPKYVKGPDGKYIDTTVAPVDPVLVPQAPIAPVKTVADLIEFETEQTSGKSIIPPGMDGAITLYQSPAYTQDTGFDLRTQPGQQEPIDQLDEQFNQLGILCGHLPKLMAFSEFIDDSILDDSYSMTGQSDVTLEEAHYIVQQKYRGRNPKSLISRWDEVQSRMHWRVELLKLIPIQSHRISFLNHSLVVELNKKNSNPQKFEREAHSKIVEIFNLVKPNGSTPIYAKLSDALQRQARRGGRAIISLFTDGEASDAPTARVVELLKNRPNPQNTPIMLLSCTNNNNEVAWFEAADTEAKYVAAVDDFLTEQLQVLRNQGPSFYYSYGVWLMCNLVGAINPLDLDALDEPYPICKLVLDEYNGRILTPQEYDGYLNHFEYRRPLAKPQVEALFKRRISDEHYQGYVDGFKDIPSCRMPFEFKRELATRMMTPEEIKRAITSLNTVPLYATAPPADAVLHHQGSFGQFAFMPAPLYGQQSGAVHGHPQQGGPQAHVHGQGYYHPR